MSPAKAPAAEAPGALSLRTWFLEAEAAAQIARQVADTPFVPDSLKVWTNPQERDPAKRIIDLDNTVATVTAALLAGQELGFSPMASLRSMDVIKGTPALRAIALRALVQSHGHDIVVIESNGVLARVRGCRAGGEAQESMWTLDRAKLLGLYPGPEYGQWRRQPQAQLVARATAEVARWVAADAILGLPYIAEELRDSYNEVPPDLPESAAEPSGAPAKANRKRGALRALPAPPLPRREPEQPAAEQPITDEQVRELNAVLRAQGIRGRTDAAAAVRRFIDRDVEKATDLTYDEAVKVLSDIKSEAARARAEQDAEPGPDTEPEEEGSQGDGAADE